MTGNEVRKAFLDYFARQQHKVLPSSPLVPQKDPTLLFANAGMVQFKSVFLGEQDIGTRRATTSQKCLRVSGKHNDFENVGRTARHHTFFEMLGNFSFGDYFKHDAIRFAWELLTQVYKLDPDKMYASVFETDDEAADIWLNEIGVPKEHVVRFGEADNFWSMGDTGPCGPCSEILYDQGPEFAGTLEDGDRYLELWNLVFMQYNRDESGVMTPLPRPSIDTGAGLERITAVLQGVETNYDSDLFTAIHRETSRLSGLTYGADPDMTVSMRVVADHVRAMTFLIGDGVLPSNEGRGYVLRRIMRRAARHGVLLGVREPFLFQVSGAVVETMCGQYPELRDRASFIAKIVKNEEERFLRTLENGLKLLNAELGKAAGVLDGEVAFKLYDTFGFPLDLTEDICRDRDVAIDQESFEKAMARQRAQSRAAWDGSGAAELADGHRELLAKGYTTEFVGYETLKSDAEVIGLILDGALVDQLTAGQKGELVVDVTPFYAEMGGQVGDRGRVLHGDALVDVTDAIQLGETLVSHHVKVQKGIVKVGDRVTMAIDPNRRRRIQRNHTATHLLHKALQEVLGPDAKQAGSLVAPDRLRFDFTHFTAMTPEELAAVERRVNELVMEDEAISVDQEDYKEAVKKGAMALFGEKYDAEVRVISIGADTSCELCGGTHLQRTGQIGPFVIVHEGSVAAGVRRIEAVTGDGAVAHLQTNEERLRTTAELLKTTPGDLVDRTEKLLGELRAAHKDIERLKNQLAGQAGANILDEVIEHDGVKVLAATTHVADAAELRQFAVGLRDKLGSGVIFLAADGGGKALLLAMVTDDLTGRFHAGKIVGPAAKAIGGGGGGKPDLAQAGGKDVTRLDDAVAAALEVIKSM
ncbi:MAG: alanine--tRNA ligase [Candidatus Lernaella stagnicola]|nr:alanine--tRNA ligase [Candidatus Lernaella stagnicola]